MNDSSGKLGRQGFNKLLSMLIGLGLAFGSTLAFGGSGHGQGQFNQKPRAQAAAEPGVRSKLMAERKLGKRLKKMLRRMQQQGQAEGEMVDVIVRYKDKPDQAEKYRSTQLGAQHKRGYKRLKMRTLSVPKHKLELLAKGKRVEFISLDSPVTSLSRSAKKTAKLPEQASANGIYTGSGVTVAVLDSGVAGHADVNVQLALDCTAEAAGGSETLRDEFNTTSYINSDGSMNWSSNAWIETGDDNTPNTGEITVEVDDCPDAGSRCIEFDSDTYALNDTLEREVNLSGAASATLSFDYHLDFAGAEYLLEVSSDGGASWEPTPLATYSTPALVFGENIDLTPYASPNTRIRFRLTDTDGNAHLYIDDLQIDYTLAEGGCSTVKT